VRRQARAASERKAKTPAADDDDDDDDERAKSIEESFIIEAKGARGGRGKARRRPAEDEEAGRGCGRKQCIAQAMR
jgi:hypothetical protein